MMKLRIFLMLQSLMIRTDIPIVQSYTQKDPKSVEKWFNNFPISKQKLSELHFFYHDNVSGKNPSTVTVAQPITIFQSQALFGYVEVIDGPLTDGPEPDSNIVGRAQGIYTFASSEDIGLLMTFNFMVTYGKFNASTLSVLGHNPVFQKYREMPIIGDSGVFRLARGIATTRTVWFNVTTADV